MRLTKMISNKSLLQYLRYIVHLKQPSDQVIFAVHANLLYFFYLRCLRAFLARQSSGK